jgi:hypothetical protein
MSSLLAALQATFADATAVRADAAPVTPAAARSESNTNVEFLDALDADGLSAASARRLAAVREPNAALRHERATVRALPPPRVRQLEQLAATRRDSLDGTLGWLIALGNAHLALDHEDSSKAKKSDKASKKDHRKSASASGPPPLASMEQLLLAKDEQILALNRRVDETETKYLNAFALLSLDDKRRLTAMTAAPSPAPVVASKPRDKQSSSSSSSKLRHKEKRSSNATAAVVSPTSVVPPVTTVPVQPSPPTAPPAPPAGQPPEVEHIETISDNDDDDDDDDDNDDDNDNDVAVVADVAQQDASEIHNVEPPHPPPVEELPESSVSAAAPESAD